MTFVSDKHDPKCPHEIEICVEKVSMFNTLVRTFQYILEALCFGPPRELIYSHDKIYENGDPTETITFFMCPY